MNLINELNERRYTIEDLVRIYYKEILRCVKEFKSEGTELSEDAYYQFAENESRLDHLTFDEFKKIIDIDTEYEALLKVMPVGRFSNTPGGAKGAEMRAEMVAITNKALVRRLSQDMCEDAKTILDVDYKYLGQLGYLGEQDEAVPEIVRGNFLMYAQKEILKDEVRGCNEAIDRMQYVLRRMKGRERSGLDEWEVEHYFVDMPISKIRQNLGALKCPPIEDFREKYIADFHEEKLHRYTMDVENNRAKKVKEMMDGNTFVTSKDYRALSDWGYAGKDEHPLIQSGYRLYVETYAFEKTKKAQLNLAKKFYYDISGIPGIREHLEGPEISDDWNAMSDVSDFLVYQIQKSRYNKGNISKTEFEKARARKERNDRYSTPIRLAQKIGGVGKVSFDNRRDIDEMYEDK